MKGLKESSRELAGRLRASPPMNPNTQTPKRGSVCQKSIGGWDAIHK